MYVFVLLRVLFCAHLLARLVLYIYRVAQKKRPEHSHAMYSRVVEMNQYVWANIFEYV